MSAASYALRKNLEVLETYWMLARIIVPITILAEVLVRTGLIAKIAPAFGPVMSLAGLPPELGLAWLTGLLVGLWGAIPLIFTLVPVSELSGADITVFSALLLIAHALPIEQKIIQNAGPGMIVTSVVRVGGGLLYAIILHHVLSATGWLSAPADPAWIPMERSTDWAGFFTGLLNTMVGMFVILMVLFWVLEFLKRTGLLKLMMKALAPVLRLAGIREESGHLAAVGLFLGISYGGGLLIQEARSGAVSPRQVFLCCVFMGFAHSIIDDTLIVVALGADVTGVLVGRVVFAIAATAAIASLLRRMPEETFVA